MAATAFALLAPVGAAWAQTSCSQPAARAASVEGRVEVRSGAQSDWAPLRSEQSLCTGDTVRVFERSRAGLLLDNDVLLRLDQNSILTLGEAQPDKPSVMELLRGWLHVITRHRKPFQVTTPVVNAMVEGTEFTVSAEPDEATVAVDEGRVQMQAPGGTLTLEGGQAGIARAGGAPQPLPRVRPRDAVQWAVYFPPVLRHRPGLADPALAALEREASALALAGDATAALERVQRIPEVERGDALRSFEASLLLNVGRVQEAEAILAGLAEPGEALPVRAVVRLIGGDTAQAALDAQAALQARPTAAAWLAQSLVQQSAFRLDQALASAQRATEVEPDNPIALARLAELELARDDSAGARRTAQRALELSPRFGRGHAILGFALLTLGRTRAALAAFDTATAAEQGDPLPRLGKGLALIRTGQLVPGRRELELAVLLDPGNALLRSYLGKAYFEENSAARDQLAATQYGLAQTADPNDPTPWLYAAILSQSRNQPVKALREAERSIALNDNRAVYRSRLRLDQDIATREAGLARVYRDIGLDQRGLVEAARSIDADPGNYSAHRFLSESYAALPRHEIAQVSELLQSQLLQPLSLNPAPARLAQSDLSVLRDAAPSDPSFNEYSSLFVRDGWRLRLNAIGGSNQTFGDDLTLSALTGPVALSFGQFRYGTDGWRPNSDYRDDIYNAFAQVALSDRTSIQAEVRTRNLEHGDIQMRALQPDPRPDVRRTLDQDTARLGLRHALSPATDLLVSVIYQDRREGVRDASVATVTGLPFPFPPTLNFNTQLTTDRTDRALTGEAQLITRRQRFRAVLGGGHTDSNGQAAAGGNVTVTPPNPFISGGPLPTMALDTSVKQLNGYLYTYLRPHPSVDVTVGVSADRYEDFTVTRDQINPKLGLTWAATSSTLLRAAWFRTLKRALVADQTLEPTQVAGFNQFFDDINGTDARRMGIGIDQRFGASVFAGLEGSLRQLTVPFGVEEQQRERLWRAYGGWTPSERFTLTAQLGVETVSAEPSQPTVDRPLQLRTVRAPLEARWFANARWSASARIQGVWQETVSEDSTRTRTAFDETFTLVDVSLSYRLPARKGIVSLEVLNLFDQQFVYQDPYYRSSVPRLPEFLPERTVYLKINLLLP